MDQPHIDGIVSLRIDVPLRALLPQEDLESLTDDDKISLLQQAFITMVSPIQLLRAIPAVALEANTGVYNVLRVAQVSLLHDHVDVEEIGLAMPTIVIMATHDAINDINKDFDDDDDGDVDNTFYDIMSSLYDKEEN